MSDLMLAAFVVFTAMLIFMCGLICGLMYATKMIEEENL
jgi:NADH:ubiquinone oxidoreductase subunit 3 (subunit A)